MNNHTYDDLENRVIDAINYAANTLLSAREKSNSRWTKQIMSSLTELAYEHYNYHVYSNPNDYETTMNEWLYDMMWYEIEDNNVHELKKIHLILESEWLKSFKELRYDFDKLLLGRARHRVFIFQSDDIEKTIGQLKSIIDRSTISEKNDRYILAGWNDETGFEFTLHIKS